MQKDKFNLKNDPHARQVLHAGNSFFILGIEDTVYLKKTYDKFVYEEGMGLILHIKRYFYKVYGNSYVNSSGLRYYFLTYLLLPVPYKLKCKSLMDIGCSSGDFLQSLPTHIKKTGIEINRRAAQVCRSKGLDVFEGTFEDFNLNKRYDILRAFHVIEHVKDVLPFFNKFKRHLKPSGVCIVATPNGGSFSRKIFNANWEGFYDTTHFTIFSHESFQKLAKDNGMIIRYATTYPMGYAAASLLRVLNVKSPRIYWAMFWCLFCLLYPVDLFVSFLGYGDALYVEFENA